MDWRRFWEHSSGRQLDLYVAEGEHFTFTDHRAFLPQLEAAFPLPAGLVAAGIGTVDMDRIVGSVRAYLTAFSTSTCATARSPCCGASRRGIRRSPSSGDRALRWVFQ